MTKQLVIFGLGDIGELAHYYFTNDSEYEIAAFTVDEEYITSDEFCGLPVIAFENIKDKYPPQKYDLFIAISYSNLNEIRKSKYFAAKEMGYYLPSYISSRASVLNQGNIGDNCFILEDNTIQPFVTIGNNVTLWSGNHIGHHSTIADHCFFASHIVISGRVKVNESCFVGVNATFRNGITIGSKSIIGAGALILKSVDPEGLYIGTKTERAKRASTELQRI